MAKPRRSMIEIRAAAAERKAQKAEARRVREARTLANKAAKRQRHEAYQARRRAVVARCQATRAKARGTREVREARLAQRRNWAAFGHASLVGIPRTELMERLGTTTFAGATAVPVTNTGGMAREAVAIDKVNAHRLVSVIDRVNFVSPTITAGRQEWVIYSGASDSVENDMADAIDAYHAEMRAKGSESEIQASTVEADLEGILVAKIALKTATLEEVVMLAILTDVNIDDILSVSEITEVQVAEDGETDGDLQFAERVSFRKTVAREDHGARKGYRKVNRSRGAKRKMQIEADRKVIRDQRLARRQRIETEQERQVVEHQQQYALDQFEIKYGRWCRKTVKPVSPRIIWRSFVAAKKVEEIVPLSSDLERMYAYRAGPDLDSWRAHITPIVEARAKADRKARKDAKRQMRREAEATSATPDLVVAPRKERDRNGRSPLDMILTLA